MKHKCVFAVLALIGLTGCSIFSKPDKPAPPAPPYSTLPDVLDEEYLHSPSGDIAAHFPAGWLPVDIQTIPMANVEKVFTDPERRRALVLAEIPATAEFRRSVARDGMAALAEESFATKSDKTDGKLIIIKPTQIYSENGKLFASYEYAESGADSLNRRENRDVLFTTGSKFYELGMVELDTPQHPDDHVQNFRLLESVTASLVGVAEIQVDTASQ